MILGHQAGCTLYFQLAFNVFQVPVVQQTHHIGVFGMSIDGMVASAFRHNGDDSGFDSIRLEALRGLS